MALALDFILTLVAGASTACIGVTPLDLLWTHCDVCGGTPTQTNFIAILLSITMFDAQSVFGHCTSQPSHLGDQGRFPIIIPPASMSASPFISTLHDHASHETWSQRSSALLSTLTSQISALQRSIHLKERHLEEVLPLVQTLAAAARESPAHTAHALASRGLHAPHLRSHTQRPVLACAGAGADGRACRRRVLPFSRYCLKRECFSVL